MKKYIFTFFIAFFSIINCFSQEKFKVKVTETDTWRDIYHLIDEKGKTIKELDSSKYYIYLSDSSYKHFAIFGIKGESGWSAIDKNENILFKVYNQANGEPFPDYIRENKIRIVDENGRIGFADEKGKIIITPQFNSVTYFSNGYAIIGENCNKVYWDDDAHNNDSGCNHYSIECTQTGYINENGDILKLGNFTFEEIAKEINWHPEEY